MRTTYPKEKRIKPKQPYARTVHIDGEEWSWQVNGNYIFMSSPDGTKRLKVSHWDFCGVDPDTIERAHWKGYMHRFAITPGKVKAYMQEHMM